MRIKLLADHNGTPTGSIVDCDDKAGAELIEKSIAVADGSTPESIAKEIEQLVDKSINIHIKKDITMSDPKEFAIGKMFSAVAKKAITGNSETGSAADGGAVVYTGMAELVPIIMQNSQVYGKCRKIPVSKGANAMKVPISISDYVIKGTAPVVSNVAEGIAGTPTKIQFGSRTLTFAKSIIPVAVTSELMEDVPAMDAYVRTEIVGKLSNVLDYEVVLGSTAGYTGAIGDTGYTLTQSLSATPTLNELTLMTLKVHPMLNPEFYMSATYWALCVATLGTAANLQNQLINIAGRELLGKKVNILPCLSATQVIYADWSGYTVIESPLGDRLTMSNDVRFLEDESVFKLVHRGAGAGTTAAKATGDSLSISYACQKA